MKNRNQPHFTRSRSAASSRSAMTREPLRRLGKSFLAFALLWSLVWSSFAGTASALNSDAQSGNKPLHYTGYRYLNDHQVQVWFDKGLPSTNNILPEQIHIYSGSDTTGTPIPVRSLTPGSGSNQTASGLPSGSSYVLDIATSGSGQANPTFQPGWTYTVVISKTVRANNGITIGAFNNNQDITFSFLVPEADNSYSQAILPEVRYSVQDGATGVPVEGNLWFSVNVPVSDYASVLGGIVLKENGVQLPFDPTIDANPVTGARTFAPQVSVDHTYFFLPLTGSGGAASYDLSLGATYSLEIPAMQTVNRQTIPARTLTFTTTPTDIPTTMGAVTSTVSAGKLQLGWSSPAYATGANLYYSEDQYWGYRKLNATPIASSPYEVTGLMPGKEYWFRAAGVNPSGEGGLSPAAAATVPTSPIPVWVDGALTYDKTSDSALTLHWQGAVDDVAVTGYKIYHNGQLAAVPDSVTATTYAIAGLDFSAAQQFKVEAVDGGGNESTDGPAVDVPAASSGGADGGGTGNPGGGGAPGGGSPGGTGNPGGGTPGGGAPGDGAPGGTGGTEDTIPPVFPPGSTLTATKTAQLEADISWTGASDNVGVTGYRIYLDSNPTSAYSLSGTETSFHAAGLPTGPHTLRVQAVDAAGNISTNGPSGELGGTGSSQPFSVSMQVASNDPTHTVLQFDFTNGIDTTLNSVLQLIKLQEKSTGAVIGYSSQQYIKQGTDWEPGVEKLRRLNLTYTQLKANTDYVVTMDGGVTANNGNSLGHTYTWEFNLSSAAGGGTITPAGGGAAGTPTTSASAVLPEQIGSVRKSDTGGAQLQTDLAKLKALLQKMTGGALAVDLSGMTAEGATGPDRGIELPADAVKLLKDGNKTLILQDGGFSWSLPAKALQDQTDLTFVLSDRGAAETAEVPAHVALRGRYELSAYAGGTPWTAASEGMVFDFAKPAQTADPDKLVIHHRNAASGKWEYAGGRMVNGSLRLEGGGFGTYVVGESTATFADIGSHWAKHQVEVLAARQIASGTGGGSFEPNRAITRAEFAVLLAKVLQLGPVSAAATFTDVPDKSWYAAGIAQVAAAGITAGDGKAFRPDAAISREEMAVMVVKAYAYAGGKIDQASSAAYSDAGQTSAWAKDSVQQAYAAGLIGGRPNGTFGPKEQATRAECAVLLLRLMDKAGL